MRNDDVVGAVGCSNDRRRAVSCQGRCRASCRASLSPGWCCRLAAGACRRRHRRRATVPARGQRDRCGDGGGCSRSCRIDVAMTSPGSRGTGDNRHARRAAGSFAAVEVVRGVVQHYAWGDPDVHPPPARRRARRPAVGRAVAGHAPQRPGQRSPTARPLERRHGRSALPAEGAGGRRNRCRCRPTPTQSRRRPASRAGAIRTIPTEAGAAVRPDAVRGAVRRAPRRRHADAARRARRRRAARTCVAADGVRAPRSRRCTAARLDAEPSDRRLRTQRSGSRRSGCGGWTRCTRAIRAWR